VRAHHQVCVDENTLITHRLNWLDRGPVDEQWRPDGQLVQASCRRVCVILRDVKTFFTLFYFGHVFTFLMFFFIFQTFFYFYKNVGKVQSGKQTNKKHFQNNSNEIGL